MNNKIKVSLYWIILIQPFLDIYWLYYPPLSEILPFALPTIIRILGVIVILGMFFSQKHNWQRLGKQLWIVAYIIILIFYSVLHIWHVKDFNSVDPTNYGYSTLGEIFYLIRMVLPLITIYITCYAEITIYITCYADFYSVIKWIIGLFSGTIVITNLFTISLMSYESVLDPGLHFIKGNIFTWFTNNPLNYYFLASKGLFYKANTLSAIMLMLLPLMLYIVVKEPNWKNSGLYLTQSLAMLELGTKVATIGLFITTAVFLIIYLLHSFIFKDIKLNKKAILILTIITLFSSLIFPHAPSIQRANYDSTSTPLHITSKTKKKSKQLNEVLSDGLKQNRGEKRRNFLIKFIKHNAAAYALNQRFIEKSYSYKYDPDFWLKIMKMPIQQRMNYRIIERKMLDQVVKNNNNRLDNWLGISYIRENNIFILERDFLAQKYSLGWIGMLLFTGIYLLIILYSASKWLLNKAYRKLQNTALLMSTSLLTISAFYAGNVLDFLTATFIFAFILGYLLSKMRQEKRS